jgi:hypothetical protein
MYISLLSLGMSETEPDSSSSSQVYPTIVLLLYPRARVANHHESDSWMHAG